MFDPTAFENIKVVIEGAVYERDLDGEILVTDRNDIMNLAKLERKFEIAFVDANHQSKKIAAILILEAGLENLAAELLPATLSEKKSGCQLMVKYICKHQNDMAIFNKIQNILAGIWGNSRTIEQQVNFNPFDKTEKVTNEIIIHFNRLIFEDNIDDLTDMVDFMIKSLRELHNITK
jgi:hypothetical protein